MTFTATPMQCASLMMRNHSDPGLIAAYLALELERDPRIAMTPRQRALYDLGCQFRQIGRTLQERLVPAMTAWSRAYDQLVEIQRRDELAIRAGFNTVPPSREELTRLRPADFGP